MDGISGSPGVNPQRQFLPGRQPQPARPQDSYQPRLAGSPDAQLRLYREELSKLKQWRADIRQESEGAGVRVRPQNASGLAAQGERSVTDSLARVSALAEENAQRNRDMAADLQSPESRRQATDSGTTVNGKRGGPYLPYGSITYRNAEGKVETLPLEASDFAGQKLSFVADNDTIRTGSDNGRRPGLMTRVELDGESYFLGGPREGGTWDQRSWDQLPEPLRHKIEEIKARPGSRLLSEAQLLAHGDLGKPDRGGRFQGQTVDLNDPAQVREYRERVSDFRTRHAQELKDFQDPRLGRELEKLDRNLEVQQRVSERVRGVEDIANIRDDTLRNLRITQSYHELSKDLGEMLGPEAGANWATWATWASKQAGTVIRKEQSLSSVHDPSVEIARGNRKVYAEVAPEFARFIETFKGDKARDSEKFEAYASHFKPGQEELKTAFTAYYDAMFEGDAKKKQELMLLGNLHIGNHEQTRLDPEIDASIPYGTRTAATEFAMELRLPRETLNLGDDLPPTRAGDFPPNLRHLENPQLRSLLKRVDETPDSLASTAAWDWTELPDRMHFISDLFRSRHMEPSLFEAPFSPEQTRQLAADRVPNGPL